MAGSLAPTASAALDTVPHKPSVNQPAFSVLGYDKSADYPRCAHAARRERRGATRPGGTVPFKTHGSEFASNSPRASRVI